MKKLCRKLCRLSLSILIGVAGVLSVPPVQALDYIKAAIVVTNAPTTNGMALTINGVTRTWTNSTAGSPSTLILTNTSIGGSATNLYTQLASYSVGTGIGLLRVSTNEVDLQSTLGGALTVTAAGSWASITYSTQTVTTPFTIPVVLPIGIHAPTNQTNIASLMVAAQNLSTSSFSGTSIATTNLMPRANGYNTNGIFDGPTSTNATLVNVLGLSGVLGKTTNGYNTNGVFDGPTLTNGQNFGKPFRSPGGGGGSEQFGLNASAGTNAASAFGDFASAQGIDSSAFGFGATASADSTSAFGQSTASSLYSLAMGWGNTSSSTGALSIGGFNLASGYESAVFGFSGDVESRFGLGLGGFTVIDPTHQASVALGYQATTTASNQIRLGTVNHQVSIPGTLQVEIGATNFITRGTNVFRGSISYPHFDLTTLAAGAVNVAVPFGTNRVVRVGALASAATIAGAVGAANSGGPDDQDILLENRSGFGLTLAVSTADPVPGNRFAGTDTLIPDQGFAFLIYEGTESRWRVAGLFPNTNLTATATNSVSSVQTNGTPILGVGVTNINFTYGGTGYVSGSSVFIGVSAVSGYPLCQISTNTGNTDVYYPIAQGNTFAFTSGLLHTNNNMRLMPFYSGMGGSMDSYLVNVTTTVGASNFRMGVYSSLNPTNLMPGALLTGGDVQFDSSGSGTKITNMVSAARLLPGKLYWFAVEANAAIGLKCPASTGGLPVFGMNTNFTFNIALELLSIGYGSFPATCPLTNTLWLSTATAPVSAGLRFNNL